MDTLTPLSTFILLLLSVITLATAAGVGFQRGKIAKLNSDLAESDARAARLEKALTETRAELATARVDLDALGRVVTGESHWVAIGETLDHHHAEAMVNWERERETLERIALAVEREGGP